jgi:hypothetical protein
VPDQAVRAQQAERRGHFLAVEIALLRHLSHSERMLDSSMKTSISPGSRKSTSVVSSVQSATGTSSGREAPVGPGHVQVASAVPPMQ